MKSKWFELKQEALAMRRSGMSMTTVERKLGIPRSTLSGWFKNINLSEEQRVRLMKNRRDGWKKARERAVESHRAQRALRLLEAEKAAAETIAALTLSPEILDLAFAFLYLGEGTKKNTTAISSSDPLILRFVLTVLQRNYGIGPNKVRCDLHLRMDQDADALKSYWSETLGVPLSSFRGVSYDKRSANTSTYESYKGVCVLYCGSIAIQRKLISLYNLFCTNIANVGV